MNNIIENSKKDTINDKIYDLYKSSTIINEYCKIAPRYINQKKSSIFNREHKISILYRKYKKYRKEILNKTKSTSQSEGNGTKFFLKENKESQTSLFTNSLIREKQKRFRLNSINIKKLNLNIECKNKEKDKESIVNNNIKLYKAFLSRTKSNFNNKYKIKYKISNFEKKGQIKKLFDKIKMQQNKHNFSDYLENQISKRCLSSRTSINTSNRNNNDFSQILSYNHQINNLKNINNKILSKKNLVDSVKSKEYDLKNNNKHFFNNYVLFKTIPLKLFKRKKEN